MKDINKYYGQLTCDHKAMVFNLQDPYEIKSVKDLLNSYFDLFKFVFSILLPVVILSLLLS